MSQVKIQGNASGTGIFTIASPNSNNTRTMTLSDTDGTIYIAPGDGIQALASGVPVARTITAGTGISITNGNGVGGNPTISATSTGLPGSQGQVFTSSGTFTVPSGITAVKVTVLGGGGGGGSARTPTCGVSRGGGGGGGGLAIKFVTGLTPGGTVSVTVGGGGAGGTPNNAGSTGGTSSFGAYCSATGGGGGGNGFNGTGSVGALGSGSSGDINLSGIRAYYNANDIGMAPMFGGVALTAGAEQNGNAGANYGSGGTGGYTSAAGKNGGAGSVGLVMVEW